MHALWGAWVAAKHTDIVAAKHGVDAEGIITALLSRCHPAQREFVRDMALLVCACIARGGGKTTAARVKFLVQMLRVPKSECLFIATTRGQAEKFMWGPLKSLLKTLKIAAKFNETKLVCTLLHNNSKLYLVGADNKSEIEKLRGLPFHLVGADEGASYPIELLKNLFYRIIEPRLGDYDGRFFLFGTPGHILDGMFYELTRNGSELARPYKDRDLPEHKDTDLWSFHTWNLKDGAETIPAMAKLWARALRNKRVNGWTDDNPVWRREYLGFWAADDTENVYRYRPHLEDGTEWNMWDPAKDKDGFAVMPKNFTEWSYSYGMDMGHSDPFALAVLAWSPQDPKKILYHVYEFSKTEMFSDRIAGLLIGEKMNASEPEGCIGATGWPDAMVADIAGMGGAILDQLAEVNGIRILPAEKKNKHDSIELFNGDLIDGRIKIMKGSVLAEQLMTLQWAVDDYGRLKEHKGMRNDCTDAAIYSRRAASHLLSEEEGPKAPYFPERKDMMLVPDDSINSEDDFSDILGDDYYDGF